MSYINGEKCLPEELIKEIRKYVSGEYIYIPKEDNQRKCWGSNTGTRQELRLRNEAIYHHYISGNSVKELADHYYLSIKSIQRIVLNEKRKDTQSE